jgi:hypothetical protein
MEEKKQSGTMKEFGFELEWQKFGGFPYVMYLAESERYEYRAMFIPPGLAPHPDKLWDLEITDKITKETKHKNYFCSESDLCYAAHSWERLSRTFKRAA